MAVSPPISSLTHVDLGRRCVFSVVWSVCLCVWCYDCSVPANEPLGRCTVRAWSHFSSAVHPYCHFSILPYHGKQCVVFDSTATVLRCRRDHTAVGVSWHLCAVRTCDPFDPDPLPILVLFVLYEKQCDGVASSFGFIADPKSEEINNNKTHNSQTAPTFVTFPLFKFIYTTRNSRFETPRNL